MTWRRQRNCCKSASGVLAGLGTKLALCVVLACAFTRCDYLRALFAGKHLYSLTRVSALNIQGCACDVALSGDCAYLAADSGTSSGAIVAVNVANPASPYEVGRLDLGEWVYRVCVHDSLAFLGDWDSHLIVVDIRDPAHMSVLSRLNLTGFSGTAVYSIVVDSQYAYCTVCTGSYSGNSLHVIDISNPAAPLVVGKVDPHEGLRWIVKRSSYVYAIGGGLSTFLVADPKVPKYLGTLGLPNYEGDLPYPHGATVGDHLYVSDNDLVDIDLSNPSSPSVTTTTKVPGYVFGVAAEDSILYYTHFAAGASQSCTLSVRVGDEIEYTATGAWLGYSITAAANHVYLACGDSGIAVYELTRFQ